MAQLVKIETSTDIRIVNIDLIKQIYIDDDDDIRIEFTDDTSTYITCDSKKEAKKTIGNIIPFNFSDEHKTLDI